ncbi:uncharacterized protein FIBRA_02607 [Fibroporia radiculosa]|uniref:Uncharacterized protein n=1 Tax=Fibroporia radiculosa TaxID=599839 RepID=J4G201_9APHY|nr:uncharacterized protein FIBRA_02607 [Fibroporia radiculosa]CCM00573.1 predicted protein [Fibroporia radiculosa]
MDSRNVSMGQKLRTLIAPKPKLPSRNPERRRHDLQESSGDKSGQSTNLDDVRSGRPRHRLTSESTESVATIREPRRRTTSQDSVRTVKGVLAAPPRTRKVSGACPPPPSLVKPPAPVLGVTATHNHGESSKSERVKEKRKAAALDFEPSAQEPEKPARKTKGLKRARKYRDLSAYGQEAAVEFPTSESSVSVLEVEEDLSEEWAKGRLSRRLSDNDEDIIRSIVSSIVEDAEINGEAVEGQDGSCLFDIGNLQEIPGLDEDTEDKGKQSCRSSWLDAGTSSLSSCRFNVAIKPKDRHCTMWDIDFDDVYAWSGVIYITDNKPYAGPPRESPIHDLDIEWWMVDASYASEPDMRPDYSTAFAGQMLAPSQLVERFDPSLGICTDLGWVYLPSNLSNTGAGGSWALRFWVPVPMAIFRGRECCKFQVQARIDFGTWGSTYAIVQSPVEDITMEQLVTEKEMGKQAGRLRS